MRYFVFLLLAFPLFVHAASVQEYLQDILVFANGTLIPAIFALAVFFFIFNAARFFIFTGTSSEGRENAKKLMIWGITALVIMLSIWGIVAITVDLFGIGGGGAICPEYVENCGTVMDPVDGF